MSSIMAAAATLVDLQRRSSSPSNQSRDACALQQCAACKRTITPNADVFMGFDKPFCSNHCRTEKLLQELDAGESVPPRGKHLWQM